MKCVRCKERPMGASGIDGKNSGLCPDCKAAELGLPSSAVVGASDEALAQAREQLKHEADGIDGSAFIVWCADRLVTERATVIELRRQLARVTERCKERVGEALELQREKDALRTELATERQRLEESEADRRTQYCRADAAERLLATERQRAEVAYAVQSGLAARAEAAERSRDGWHDRACKDAAGWKSTEVRLEASEKRAEAAERVRDAMAENWDKLCAHRDQWQQRAEVAEAAVEGWRDSFKHHMEASEAKRKALREALVKYGSHRSGCSVSMRGTEDEGCTCGFYRLTCDDDLAADGKDTPPEETSMRGVRDDSEHYT